METIEKIKDPVHVLACFEDAETGKAMSELAAYMAISGSEHSTITFLHLTSEEVDETKPVIEENYQSDAFRVLKSKEAKNKLAVRTFIKRADDKVAEIKKTLKERGSTLLIFGVKSDIFNPAVYRKFSTLKSNPTLSESDVKSKMYYQEWEVLNKVADLFDMNPVTTCLFINKRVDNLDRIFIPILNNSDVRVLPSVITRLTRKDNTEYMIWDAIGEMESNAKLQKFFSSCQKVPEISVQLWENDRKIDLDFISKQNLMLISLDGWSKLLKTNLPWIESLPSTLIIKYKTT